MIPEEAGEIKLVAEFQLEGDFPYGAVRPGKKTGCPVDKKTVEKLFRRNSGIPDEILDEGTADERCRGGELCSVCGSSPRPKTCIMNKSRIDITASTVICTECQSDMHAHLKGHH